MLNKIEDISFFNKDAKALAKDLIGKWIICNDKIGQICEVEAYNGINDSACHSYKNKKTSRTEVMWGENGIIYIYLCYGLHNMFNIVCGGLNNPQAVLIRGIVGHVGPGKVTKYFNIDKSFNGKSIINNPNIYLADDGKKYKYYSASRVGINYALYKDRIAKLRYCLKI